LDSPRQEDDFVSNYLSPTKFGQNLWVYYNTRQYLLICSDSVSLINKCPFTVGDESIHNRWFFNIQYYAMRQSLSLAHNPVGRGCSLLSTI